MVALPRPMNDATRPIAAIVLAAGKGTRMNSATHKVLMPVAGRPMILHLLDALAELGPERTVAVVGDLREQLAVALGDKADLVVQQPQLGTGHAVRQAEPALGGFKGDVLILYGDVPFVSPATMRAMIDRLNAKLRGYYNYYGVQGNFASLQRFFVGVLWRLRKQLNQRSQRKSYNGTGFRELIEQFRIERPQIAGRPKTSLVAKMA